MWVKQIINANLFKYKNYIFNFMSFINSEQKFAIFGSTWMVGSSIYRLLLKKGYKRIFNPLYKGDFTLLISDPLNPNGDDYKENNKFANIAINNSGYEISPYIAVSEIADANTDLLNKLYDTLPENIKNSKYGKILGELIKY